jgi:hypothetical protein
MITSHTTRTRTALPVQQQRLDSTFAHACWRNNHWVNGCRHYGHFFPVLYSSKYLAGHCQPREPQAFSQPHPTFCRALLALIDAIESSILNIAQVRGDELYLLRAATHVVCDSIHALDPAAAMSGIIPHALATRDFLTKFTCTLP